jgi:hypothetical protein
LSPQERKAGAKIVDSPLSECYERQLREGVLA